MSSREKRVHETPYDLSSPKRFGRRWLALMDERLRSGDPSGQCTAGQIRVLLSGLLERRNTQLRQE